MSNKIDMINKIYNQFLVIKEAPFKKGGHLYYQCQCLKCNEIFTANGQHIRNEKIRCPKCGKSKKIKDISGMRSGKLIAIKPTSERQNGSVVWLCKCDCGNIKKVRSNSFLSKSVQSCGCLTYSIGEKNIQKILSKNNINYIYQYSFPQDTRKKFDFAILNKENEIIRLIEFDGKQHYLNDSYTWFKEDSLEKRQERDNIKNNYAIKHKIPLVRIPYWERDKITIEMLLGDKYEISIN